MKVQHENKVMSSFLQWIDHWIIEKGEAYTDHSSLFYPVENKYNGYYTYAAPFKQMVSDVGILGGNYNVETAPAVMTGVYVDGVATNIGENNLAGINHYDGQVYFTSSQGSSAISGNYSIKDFNVYLTNDPEEKILFENKYHINPRTSQTLSGLQPDVQTYPAIYLKNNGGNHVPFALGGVDTNNIDIRAVVLSDSSFKLDAACAILKTLHKSHVPIVDNLPFDAMNAYTGESYNYTGLAAKTTGNAIPNPIVWDVSVSKNVTRGEGLNPGIYTAFVDFHLQYQWRPIRENL
jgi:hypothetical protein